MLANCEKNLERSLDQRLRPSRRHLPRTVILVDAEFSSASTREAKGQRLDPEARRATSPVATRGMRRRGIGRDCSTGAPGGRPFVSLRTLPVYERIAWRASPLMHTYRRSTPEHAPGDDPIPVPTETEGGERHFRPPELPDDPGARGPAIAVNRSRGVRPLGPPGSTARDGLRWTSTGGRGVQPVAGGSGGGYLRLREGARRMCTPTPCTAPLRTTVWACDLGCEG